MTPVHHLQIALGGLCIGLLALIIGEAALESPAHGLSPDGDQRGAAAAPPQDQSVLDADALATTILERPLFSRGRRPPPDAESATPALRARLAGIMFGPQRSEALFARDGEKPLVLTEQQEIEGWTVTAITADGVVLTSALGERILKPTGVAAKGQTAKPQAASPAGGAVRASAALSNAAGGVEAPNRASTRTETTNAGVKPPGGAPAARSNTSAKVVR
jgi:hypothetical protein